LNIFISASLDLMNSFSNAGSKNRKLTGCSRMSDSHFVCLMIEALRSKLRKIFDSQGMNLTHDSLAYLCSKLQEMRSPPNSASGGLNTWIDQITSEIQYEILAWFHLRNKAHRAFYRSFLTSQRYNRFVPLYVPDSR